MRVVNFRAMTLPLTTVQTPFYELGRRAVELLLAQLRGEAVPEVVTMPTELIVRRSCGCFSEAVRPQSARADRDPSAQERPVAELFTAAIAAQREHTHRSDAASHGHAYRRVSAGLGGSPLDGVYQ